MIHMNNVTKVYPNGSTGVENINLHINKGEFVFIVGSSGSGKSTLMNMIGCLDTPTSGTYFLNGQDVSALSDNALSAIRNEQIGFIFQSFNLLEQRTVLRNICFPLEIAGVKRDEAQARAAELLELVGLSDRAKNYPSQLSGGQKQRVAIARALATRPKYLLCDEATSALDPNTTQSILHLLKEINQTLGVTIVVITHEMRVIEQICQRVAVIDQSCIAEIGNVSDVFTHPKSDIAKALILPKSPAENLPPCTGRRLRLVFDGSCSNEPVISRITLECHVPVNILFADTRIVEGSIYGHMVIDLPDDPQQFHDVLRWLDHNHISYLQEDGSHV